MRSRYLGARAFIDRERLILYRARVSVTVKEFLDRARVAPVYFSVRVRELTKLFD